MKEWYQKLSQRDRAVVLAVAAAVLLSLVFLALVKPLQQRLDGARAELESRRDLLAWMRQSAAEVQQLRASGRSTVAADDRPPYLLLDEAIRAAGLPAPSRIEPQSGGTQAQFEGVAFDRLVLLLDRLAEQRGLQVTQASMTARNDKGEVGARIVLERDEP